MSIQWYPGHMAKSFRLLEESLKLVDAVVYVLDARVPESCLNPDFDKLILDKPKMFILNKADLANPQLTAQWIKRFERDGCIALSLNATAKKRTAEIKLALRELVQTKLERKADRGIAYTPRLMIIGVSNCGKSTIINYLCGSGKAATGNKPGVTRGKQWVKIDDFADLLDTPGILPKKFDSIKAGRNLAFVGCIKDDILDISELALALIDELNLVDRDILSKRYDILNEDSDMTIAILTNIAKARGCILKGGEIDYERASRILIDDFRKARLGRVTLEKPYNQ